MRKEFNIKDYQTGKYDVVTKDGHKVRILATDADGKKPVIGLIDNKYPIQADATGRVFITTDTLYDYDLFLVSKTKKIYLVHFIDYRDIGIKGLERYRVKRYVTKEDADRFVKHCNKDPHYKFIRIEEVEVDNELLKE